jgi:hypothetical protein
MNLSDALCALAEQESHAETPPHVEGAVLARWDAAHTRRGSPLTLAGRGAVAATAGIALVGAVGAVLLRVVDQGDPPRPPLAPVRWAAVEPGPQRGIRPADDAPDALPGTAPSHHQPVRIVPAPEMRRPVPTTFLLVGEPIGRDEPLNVVHMRVAVSMLAAIGIRPAAQGDSIDIDVLVGDDGVARALRVEM